MKSPEDASDPDDIVSSPTRTRPKRKHVANPASSASSKENRITSSVSISQLDPASKRVKTSHTPGNTGRFTDMSRTATTTGLRKVVIDLTRPQSNFQPHAGAKKLTIKNLRTTPRNDVEAFYDRTWTEVKAALQSVFEGMSPATPLEILCRGVEQLCKNGLSKNMADHLRDASKTYLENKLLPQVEKHAGTTNVEALRAVYRFWTIWNSQSVCGPLLPGVERCN